MYKERPVIKWKNHYDINEKNGLMHELNGLYCKVVKSSDPQKNNMQGIIIKETKNTLVLEVNGAEKILPKKESELMIEIPSGRKIIFDGKLIMERPENRTKELWRKHYGKLQ